MEVIVHLPDTVEAGEELQRKVARVHADLVVGFIHKLPCSNQQKYDFIKYIITEGYGSVASPYDDHKT